MKLKSGIMKAASVLGHGTAAALVSSVVGMAAVGEVPALRIAAPGLTKAVTPGMTTGAVGDPGAGGNRVRVEDRPQRPAAPPVEPGPPVKGVERDPPAVPVPAGPAGRPGVAAVEPQAAPSQAPAAPDAAAVPSAPGAPTPAPSAPPPQPSAAGAPAPAAPAAKEAEQKAVVPPIQRVAPGKAAATGPVVAAKELFGKAATPAPLAARAIGSYARGCLAGAEPLAVDGPAWQAMRLSRNRNWGHPDLIRLIERFAGEAKAHDGWPGLLVGDLSQPRGGPMLTGHASHQIGLDADVWLTPMPERRLSVKEREELAATSMLAADKLSVDPKAWTEAHVRIVKRVASYPEVERVLVHPAIKKALCAATGRGPEDAWLAKVRPIWGHYYHMHVRISCPKDSPGCTHQAVPPSNLDQACTKEVADWLALIKRSLAPAPPPRPGTPPPKRAPAPPMTLEQLPPECRVVLESDVARGSQTAGAAK